MFAKRIQASFHVPKEYYHTTNGKNDYMVPPALHCVRCNNYLPPLDARVYTRDFCLEEPKRTLAYTQTLQDWAKVAKPLPLGEP